MQITKKMENRFEEFEKVKKLFSASMVKALTVIIVNCRKYFCKQSGMLKRSRKMVRRLEKLKQS